MGSDGLRARTCARFDFVGSDTARLIDELLGDDGADMKEPQFFDFSDIGVLGELLNPFGGGGGGGALGAY